MVFRRSDERLLKPQFLEAPADVGRDRGFGRTDDSRLATLAIPGQAWHKQEHKQH